MIDIRVHVLKALRVIVPRLVGVAYLTLLERKVRGGIQGRRGPNTIGVYGRRSPRADGRKLLLKENIIPGQANYIRFIIAPRITFSLARIGWAVIPRIEGYVYTDRKRGVIYVLGVSSLGVYGVRLGGWGSNSKYALLGGMRSGAQMVSYEVSMGFIVLSVLICSGTGNRTNIVRMQEKVWYAIPLLPGRGRFYVSILAETNRHPFDLPEAEAELVSGYHVEYSGIPFALYYRGEYANMIRMSSLTCLRFRGGWNGIFGFKGLRFFARKVCIRLLGFVWARGAYPRYRYDQLMRLGWKVFLPMSMGIIGITSGIRIGINACM